MNRRAVALLGVTRPFDRATSALLGFRITAGPVEWCTVQVLPCPQHTYQACPLPTAAALVRILPQHDAEPLDASHQLQTWDSTAIVTTPELLLTAYDSLTLPVIYTITIDAAEVWTLPCDSVAEVELKKYEVAAAVPTHSASCRQTQHQVLCENTPHEVTLMSNWKIRAGDTDMPLVAFLKRGGAALPLDGATVTWHMKKDGGASIVGTCTILAADEGKVAYIPQGTETAVAGSYRGVFKVNRGAGTEVTVPTEGYVTLEINATDV